jgi:NitT/TauT family transport system substrate-binding protein
MTPDLLDQARAKLRDQAVVEGDPAAKATVGAMTDARWKVFFDMAAGQGVYPKSLDYHRAYTLQFLGR